MITDDELNEKLRLWRVPAGVPVTFRSGVWQRIAAREEARQRLWWRRVAGFLAVPRHGAAVAAAAMLAGLGSAYLHAQDVNSERWRELEARYIRSVDPMAYEPGRTAPE